MTLLCNQGVILGLAPLLITIHNNLEERFRPGRREPVSPNNALSTYVPRCKEHEVTDSGIIDGYSILSLRAAKLTPFFPRVSLLSLEKSIE